MTDDEVVDALIERYLNPEYLTRVAALVRERMKVLSDFIPLTLFMFMEELDYTPMKQEVQKLKVGAFCLYALSEGLTELAEWDSLSIQRLIAECADVYKIESKAMLRAVRIGVTGRAVSTPLYETIEVLGKDRACSRLNAFADFTDREGSV